MYGVLLMAIFGVLALRQGEFRISNKRRVRGSIAKTLGIVLLLGATGAFVPYYGWLIQLGALLGVIVVGLAKAEKIPANS